jgi:hypothetical protein
MEPRDGKPPEPPPELIAALVLDIGTQLAGLAPLFVGDFPEEQLREVVDFMVAEQLLVGNEIMPSVTDPAQVKERPVILIEIKGPEGDVFTMQCQKQLGNCKTAHEALGQVMLLALLLSAPSRALLRMSGYTYTFKEPKGGDPGPNLILVK